MRSGRRSAAGDPVAAPRVPALEPAGFPDGWTRRFVAAPPRLQEAVELYRELGLEVRLERPGPEDLAEVCEGCLAAAALFRVIYTR